MDSVTLRSIARSRVTSLRDAIRAAEDFRRWVQDAATAHKALDDGPLIEDQAEIRSALDEAHTLYQLYTGAGTLSTPTDLTVYGVKIWEGQ